MKLLFKKIIFLVVAVSLINGIFLSSAKANSSQSINIQAQITGGGCVGPCCNGGCSDSVPTISGVTSSVSYTSAVINWSASDVEGPVNVVFVYGLTNSYGQTGLVTGNYSTNLSGLATSTLYYFKISATDSASQTTNFTGSFQTNSVIILPDTTGPVMSNIVVTSSLSNALVTFNTDENATSRINFGLTSGLGSTALEGIAANMFHSVTLPGLSSGKKYYFQITATDNFGNETRSQILNFETLSDTTPPPQIVNLQIQHTQNSFTLTWQNPSINFNPDFAGVKIVRKIGSAATVQNDSQGVEVYNSNGETVTDGAVSPGITYFYSLFTYDNVHNYSEPVFISDKINVIVIPEICNNGIDDNGNGLIDCADPQCVSDLSCVVIATSTTSTDKGGTKPACSDGIDNDGDGLIDFPADPGCDSPQDNNEYNPIGSNISGLLKITLDKVRFFSGARQIEMLPQQKTVSGLAGSNLSLAIRGDALASVPVSFVLHVGENEKHSFVLDKAGNIYYSDILFPASGKIQTYIEIDYGSNQLDSLEVDLQAVGLGSVVDDNGQKIAGVEVTLHKSSGEIFSASTFGQNNPLISSESANIGWVVPNGKYYLAATKDKYYSYQSDFFDVNNNIVNRSLSLVKVPPKLLDNINPNDSIIVNSGKLLDNFTAKARASGILAAQDLGKAGKAIQDLAADPTVKQVANQVVAPAAVGVVAASSLAFLSWTDILVLLRFLFLQPLLLVGRGKREKWGTIYNSLSKMPIDLALVRLINVDTGKLVQTKVTGGDGRYFFVVNAGRYRLEIRKSNLIFPSFLLKDLQIDGQRLDIYHGEEIKVTAVGAVITANIPLDPVGEKMITPKRVVLNKILRRIQSAVGWIGLVATLGSLYISPVWYMWVLLAVHLFFTFIFKRLSKPQAAKGWGIVYDESGKKPLPKVIARLFDSKFNKLVATEVTDDNGRYYFMAGDNQYYISFDHEGYESMKTSEIDLRGKAAETIAQDVKLKKK